MWIGDVAMKTWMRGRSAWRTASQARSMSWKPVRDSAVMTGPRTAVAIASTASKSPVAGDREAGLDDVDPEARQLLGDLELLGDVERDARRLLAVTQGGVEDLHMVGHGVAPVWVCLRPFPATKNLLGPKARGGVREHRKVLAAT